MNEQEIIDEAAVKEKKPRRRGRPTKAQVEAEAKAQAEAEAKAQAEAEAQAKAKEAEALSHWEPVAEMLLTAASAAVNTKFPECGPKQEEIKAVKKSAAWLLNYYLPDGDELTMHWGQVAALTVMPTGMRILKQFGTGKGRAPAQAQAMNGVAAKEG